ncbi:thymidylate kinase [Bacillus sp. M6-12]|uniref:dTMP kinase n=1 Tax=Bacillus sp. M6-12 TaxID=2054166 RepID=UPI000C793B17|nr:thymidylate kinase [Bacillus sp. M6-12]PLS19712.1 thymidylate kinase [Bacillus sp. M6-12]
MTNIQNVLNQIGNLFVIDGTDSSGKQTVSDAVYLKLIENGYKALKLTYPNYGSDTSALVKMYLNGDFGTHAEDVNPYTASTFYAVDRIGSYLKEWKEAYEDKVIIIADRYTSSNAIHQASKIENKEERKIYLDWLWDLEFVKMGLPSPTETIFLNMPIQNSLKLMEERANKITGESKKDIHEGDQNFMRKSYENACWVAEYMNWKTVYSVTEDSFKDKVEKGQPGDLRPLNDIIQEVYDFVVSRVNK